MRHESYTNYVVLVIYAEFDSPDISCKGFSMFRLTLISVLGRCPMVAFEKESELDECEFVLGFREEELFKLLLFETLDCSPFEISFTRTEPQLNINLAPAYPL